MPTPPARGDAGVVTTLRPALTFRALQAVAREVLIIAVFVIAYFTIRGATEGSAGTAFANADAIARLEGRLGIAWGASVQTAVLGHDALIAAANWVYIYGHWPVIAAATIFLYGWHREHYFVFRNAMLISALIGFVFFAAFPVAPPRLADPGLVDTVTEYSRGYRALQPPSLTNQYAALPSLHAGWNLLLGIVLLQASSRTMIRIFAVSCR